MTNAELVHRLTTGSGCFKVAMSKDGIFLELDGERHELTEDQADRVWDSMYDIAMVRRANGAST